jgi:hypothetical protein
VNRSRSRIDVRFFNMMIAIGISGSFTATFSAAVLAEDDLFAERRVFIRIYQDRAANVRHVSEMIDHYPYDLLLIATHCGDSSGYKDSEGLDRTFVVDIVIGLAHTDDPEVLSVTQFMRYILVDGVDWNDPQEKAYASKSWTIRSGLEDSSSEVSRIGSAHGLASNQATACRSP